MLSARFVTPDRRHNKCQESLRSGECHCWKAQHSQQCQSCHKRMHLNDCISHIFCGWTHRKCPTIGNNGEKGVVTIKAGFNGSVDYGCLFLRGSIAHSGQISLPTPLRIEFDNIGEVEDAKIPAAGSKESTEDDGVRESDEGSTEPECKRATKYGDREEAAEVADITVTGDDYTDGMRTNKQIAIISHKPMVGVFWS